MRGRVPPHIARITGSDTWLGIAEEAAQAVVASEVVLPLLDLYVRAGRGLSAAQQGNPEGARSEYGGLIPQEGVALAMLGLTADRLLGILSAAAGDTRVAIAHFETGLAFCGRAGYAPEYAWTAIDLAETLRARGGPGDLARADELRQEARNLASQLGMQALCGRLA